MTTAQPGQEQRMDDAVQKFAAALPQIKQGLSASGPAGALTFSDLDKVLALAQAARPTADLGEDGELVDLLIERACERMAAVNIADMKIVEAAEERLATARAKVSDRLILYAGEIEALKHDIRRAQETSSELATENVRYREALVNIAGALVADNGLAAMLSETARAVLSRSGG